MAISFPLVRTLGLSVIPDITLHISNYYIISKGHENTIFSIIILLSIPLGRSYKSITVYYHAWQIQQQCLIA